MAKTLSQIEKQIDALQREADKLRNKEVADVVSRIRAAIDHYGLTPADLFGPKPGPKPSPKSGLKPSPKPGRKAAAQAARQPRRAAAAQAPSAAAADGAAAPAAPKPARKPRVRKPDAAPSVPKYRDDTGRTWTGRGKRPDWFKAAIAAGQTAAELEIPA